MAKETIGCGRPTGAVVGESVPEENINEKENQKEGVKTMVQIGKKAPDFEAPAFYEGTFKQIKLSDYLGKWVLLCFYPGDFTFV